MGNLESSLAHENKSAAQIRAENLNSFTRTITSLRTAFPSSVETARDPSRRLKVMARKRPLNSKEQQHPDYDVVTLRGQRLWVHRCLARLDGNHFYLDNKGYIFDHVFDDTITTESIYNSSIQSLVQHASQGGSSTLIMFGATGSGKTYTLNGLMQLALQSLLGAAGAAVCLSVMEISGDEVRDLATGAVISLREDATTALHTTGLSTQRLANYMDFSLVFNELLQRRVSRATGVHDNSSRTHVLYQFSLGDTGGTLTCVDLAGSEWARDQESHSSELIQQTKAINFSLMVLKECLAARIARESGVTENKQPAYRETKLTRLLKPALEDGDALITLIATVSPSSADTEHSLDTLAHTSPAQPESFTTNVTDPDSSTTAAATDVRLWSPGQVCEWFETAARAAHTAVQRDFDAGASSAAASAREFVVLLSAKKWVSLRLHGKDSLGLVFDKTEDALPVIAKVMPTGYVNLVRDKRLREGATLLGVNGVNYSSRSELLAALKSHLKSFKSTVEALRDYDEKKPKFMTQDMLVLRNYILGDAGAGAIEEPHGEGEDKEVEQEEVAAMVAPEEYVLALLLREAPLLAPVLPSCPSLFTGKSRTGQIWGGAELVDKYLLDGPGRFTIACDGDERLGAAMHALLQEAVAAGSSVVTKRE